MNKTIEQTVAETILEQPFEVKVGEKSYQVASASTATLILVSEAISQLPHIALDTEKVVEETLSVAKDCRILGDIAAILILGAKTSQKRKKSSANQKKNGICAGLFADHTRLKLKLPLTRKRNSQKSFLKMSPPRN